MSQELVVDSRETREPGFEAAESMLRAMHGHLSDEPIARVSELIHPDAEMRLLVSYGELVQGRAAITKILQEGREASTFRARVERFEWLDEQTSLTSGQARYPMRGGGFGEGRVFWLDELREGLIWRVRVFRHAEDARRAYGEGRESTT